MLFAFLTRPLCAIRLVSCGVVLFAALSVAAATPPQIATEGYTTMAVDSNGVLYGWGDNEGGLLGGYQKAYAPLAIKTTTPMVRGYTGWKRSFLIDAQSQLWGSGANDYGQLGDGTFFVRRTGLSLLGQGFRDVAVGSYHTLAIKTDGRLLTWGYNNKGQLGNGTNNDSGKPVAPNLSTVSAVAAGDEHSLALTTDGVVWAWGDNGYGQLGDGTRKDADAPIKIGTDFTAIAAGDNFSLALKADGTLWAWGRNGDGQLGDGTRNDRALPQAVSGKYSKIAAGGRTTYAIDSAGTLWAWGSSPFGGGRELTPKAVAQQVAAISAGDSHLLLQKLDGTLYAVGANDQGQLGIDDDTVYQADAPIKLSSQLLSFAAGGNQALLITPAGSVVIWGDNTEGQLAQGLDARISTPIVLGNNVKQLALGSSVAYVVRPDGNLWGWGTNYDGRLGDGTQRDRVVPQLIGTGFASASTGNTQSFGIKADGSLWAWGSNDFGQLGLGDTVNRNVPTKVGDGYAAVSAGAEHTLALKLDGSLWTWGRNRFGQLGNGLFETRFGQQANPLPIKIGDGYVAIKAGYHHCLALKADGSLWAWGWNDYGQVGDGTQESRATPINVANNIAAIQSAGIASIVTSRDDKTYVWGYNGANYREYNVLQGGTSQHNLLRPQLLAGDWVAASATSDHAAYVRRDGVTFAVGYQQFGQLGDGSFEDVRTSLGGVLDTDLKGLLDLLPAVPNQVQSSDQPAMLVRTTQQNSNGKLGLRLEFRITPVAPVKNRSGREGILDAQGYSVFVAAVVPGSQQAYSWWVLQPKIQFPDLTWDTLLFPLSAFLDNLQANSETLLASDIIANIDASLFAGSTLYIGYGLSADEMLANGRYRVFFTIPK